MRKLVTIIALLCCTFCAFAQEAVQQEDPKVTEMRQQIGIDYSMPDFKTKKIDGKLIGTHLAGMLNLLQKYYNDGTYNWKLAAIVKEQKGMVSQVSVDKLKISAIPNVGIPLIMLLSLYRINMVVQEHQKHLLNISIIWNLLWLLFLYIFIKLKITPLSSFFFPII